MSFMATTHNKAIKKRPQKAWAGLAGKKGGQRGHSSFTIIGKAILCE